MSDRPLYGQQLYGTGRYGDYTPVDDGGTPEPEPTPIPTPGILDNAYKLVLCDSEWRPVRIVRNWLTGTFAGEVNIANQITFTLLSDDPAMTSITAFARLELYGPYNDLIDRFLVANTKAAQNADTDVVVVTVTAFSRIAWLGKEFIDGYYKKGTVYDIISDLLAFQRNPQGGMITIGTIDPRIAGYETTVNVQNVTILQAINDLTASIGGWYRVTPEGLFDWGQTWGSDVGNVIRTQRNMCDVSLDTDYWTIATQVKAVGAVSGKYASVTGPTFDTYGSIVSVVSEQGALTTERLAQIASANADKLAYGTRTYQFGALDLSQIADGIDRRHAALSLGVPVRIIHDDMGLDVVTCIVKIERDLASPVQIKIEVADPTVLQLDKATGITGDGKPDGAQANPQESFIDTMAALVQAAQEAAVAPDAIQSIIDALVDPIPGPVDGPNGDPGAPEGSWFDPTIVDCTPPDVALLPGGTPYDQETRGKNPLSDVTGLLNGIYGYGPNGLLNPNNPDGIGGRAQKVKDGKDGAQGKRGVGTGRDGRDGRDGQTPTVAELTLIVEQYMQDHPITPYWVAYTGTGGS